MAYIFLLATIFLFSFQQTSSIRLAFIDRAKPLVQAIKNKNIPCSNTITYTIGSFDQRFEITKEELMQEVNDASEVWNKAVNRKLFAYATNGSIKINLIYDARQDIEQKLQKIDPVIDNMEASIATLDQEFKIKKKQYDKHKLEVVALKEATSKEKSGSQSNLELQFKKESLALEAEKVAAKKIVAKRDALYKKFIDEIDHYNALSISRRGEDYMVGRYYENKDGEQLDVYKFADKQQLRRIFIHELGHALGLEHTNNPNDIMYELNKGATDKLTENDVRALEQVCGQAGRQK